jgi:hypothetical protein
MLSLGRYPLMPAAEFEMGHGRRSEDKSTPAWLSAMLKVTIPLLYDHHLQAKPMQLVFAQSIMYHLSVNLVKVSFMLQYLRLFSHIRPMVFACYTVLLCSIGAVAWGVFGVIFLCSPTRKYWDSFVPGSCRDAEVHFWSTSIIGIILDWAIWLLPIPVVRRLKLPRRQKIGLLVVSSLGGL